MKHYEFGWKNPSNIDIYAQGWLPDSTKFEQPKAVIILIHGLGEHSSRYEHVAEFFTHYGFAIVANDRSGHGKSGNKRGHINKYNEVFDDIKQLYQETKTKFANLPVFLYGHSMGGGIVLDYFVHQNPKVFKGVIATSPLLEPAFKPPSALIFIGKMLRSVLPGVSQENSLDSTLISRDELAVQAYINDPLVHSKVTFESAIGMLKSGEKTLQYSGKIPAPLLLTHGTKDGLTSHIATQKFSSGLVGDVTVKMWEGYYHELHNEPEKMEVLDYIYQWMLQKL
jgi:alpha-beta hydrolase superfamily lysophospholipase